jgi:ureidoacrylate peracid hydrolase
VTAVVRLPARYYRNYPRPDRLGYAEETLDLPVDETVFLLIDVYGMEWDHDPGPLAHPNHHGRIIRERIAPAKAAARAVGIRTLYVTNRLRAGLSAGNEWRTMSVRTHGVDVLDTWRAPLDGHLGFSEVIAPRLDETVVEKQVFSGFFETNLDSVLQGYGARNLVAVGGDGMICLGTTVVDAMYRNYRVVALRDGVITNEYPETEAAEWASWMAIRQIETTVGYTVTTQQFIAACEAVALGHAS